MPWQLIGPKLQFKTYFWEDMHLKIFSNHIKSKGSPEQFKEASVSAVIQESSSKKIDGIPTHVEQMLYYQDTSVFRKRKWFDSCKWSLDRKNCQSVQNHSKLEVWTCSMVLKNKISLGYQKLKKMRFCYPIDIYLTNL